MTNSKIFEEVGCPEELKRYKREVSKLRKTIDILETDLSVKEYEIRQLKERLKQHEESFRNSN